MLKRHAWKPLALLTLTCGLLTGGTANATPLREVLLNVPYVSQSTGRPNDLCQFACAAMLSGQRYGSRYANIQVAQAIALRGTGTTNPGLSTINQAKAGIDAYFGPPARTAAVFISYDQLKQNLVAGRAVSVGVRYANLGNYRYDRNYGAGHQIVVIGFSERAGTWTYLDPLGGVRTVPSAVFRIAVDGASNGTGMWALYFVN
jgi:hypothetical protein